MRQIVRLAFSMVELLVVIGIITVLIGIIVPTMGKVREKSYINRCAENLRQIGEALSMYAADNHGAYPRTDVCRGRGAAIGNRPGAADPFAADGPSANDTTAAIFLLMRTQKLAPEIFLCPYVNRELAHPDITIEHARSNFTDYHQNLGYSFANPYPDADAVASGYVWGSKLPAEFVIAADTNPGIDGERDDVNLPTPESNRARWRSPTATTTAKTDRTSSSPTVTCRSKTLPSAESTTTTSTTTARK